MPECRRCPHCGVDLRPDAAEGLCSGCLLHLAMSPEGGSRSGPAGAGTTGDHAGSVPPDPDSLARHFPHLEILGVLGRGGMGVVYKARQPHLDRLVALKVLPPEVGLDPAFAGRFAREARALARLDHPGIVTVYDFGPSDGLYYLVMQFVEGADLRQVLRAGRLSPAEALRVVPQICEALQYAHEQGVVHRDIKPENILLDRKGRVKIADFGLAKLVGHDPSGRLLTGSGQVMGTPHYMAPEQTERPLAVDHRADIYSLGVVFYEMLTGELPLGRFLPPSRKAPVDERLDPVVLRALEKEPERRYQHASDVATDIKPVVSGTGRPPTAEVPTGRSVTAPEIAAVDQRLRGPAIGLLVAGVIGAAVGLLGAFAFVLNGYPTVVFPSPGQVRPAWALAETEKVWLASRAVVFGTPANLLVVLGAVLMRKRASLGFAAGSSVLAMLPWGPGWVVGLPCGIWALRVLLRPEVRAAFRLNTSPSRLQLFLESAAGWGLILSVFGALAVALPWADMLTGGHWWVYGFQSWHGQAAFSLCMALAIVLAATSDFAAPTPRWRATAVCGIGAAVIVLASLHLTSVRGRDPFFGRLYDTLYPYDTPRLPWAVWPALGLYLTLAVGLGLLVLGCLQLRASLTASRPRAASLGEGAGRAIPAWQRQGDRGGPTSSVPSHAVARPDAFREGRAGVLAENTPSAATRASPNGAEDAGRDFAEGRFAKAPLPRLFRWKVLASFVVLYGLSFVLPAYHFYTSWDRGPNDRGWIGANSNNYGWECFHNAWVFQNPCWYANPALWVGCVLLLLRKSLWAGLAALLALGLGVSVWSPFSQSSYLFGYWLWVASMAVLASGSFHGWWKQRRAGLPTRKEATSPSGVIVPQE